MADEFDPYSAWLGIREATRPLSHYRLLGLNELEENALAISIAAEATVTRLKHVDPGDRRGRLQQLLDEVTLARLCLTNPTRKVQYDQRLRDRRSAVPATLPGEIPSQQAPVQSAAVQVAAAPAGAAKLADPNRDLMPPTSPAVALAPPAVAMPVQQPFATYSSPQPVSVAQAVYVAVPVVQQSTAPVAVPMGYSLPAGLPLQGFPPMAVPVPQAMPVRQSMPGPSAVESAPEPAPAPIASEVFSPEVADLNAVLNQGAARRSRTASAPDTKLLGTIAAAVVVLAMLAGFLAFRVLGRSGQQVAGASSSVTSDGAIPDTGIAGGPEADPAPSHPDSELPTSPESVTPVVPTIQTPPPAKPQPPRTVAVTQVEVPAEQPAPRRAPTPPPQPNADPQPPAQTPEQKAAFEKALQNARAAMAARKLPLAQQELKTAKANVGTAEQDTKLAQMEELYGYVEGFWKGVFESMKGLQATDTIPVDNSEIAIVEVDGERLTIRAAGRNQSYTLETMPSWLAIVLAKRWFKPGVAANNIYLGAFHAVDPKGNLNEARRCWEAATRGGASAASLMSLLDQDTQPLASGQQAVPDKAMLTKTRAALRRAMPNEFRAARTPDQKLSLARQLLDAAQQNDNSVQRYTLLDEALNLAAEAGSATDMNDAIDGLLAGYKLDAWDLRADAFDRAAENARNPLLARALAEELVEIVDRAIAEKQSAAALKLCNALLTAAKAGKDLNLTRQAREKKARLTGKDE